MFFGNWLVIVAITLCYGVYCTWLGAYTWSHWFLYWSLSANLQEKGSNEIVFKAMGRAINKTVTIVELIKVLVSVINFCWVSFICYLFALTWDNFFVCFAEKNCWPSPEYFNWIHRHHWYMGAPGGRPLAVRSSRIFSTVLLSDDTSFLFCL